MLANARRSGNYKQQELNNFGVRIYSKSGQRDWFVFSGLHVEKLKDNSCVLLLALRKAESVKSKEY
jgi:hypothetical protein